MATRMKHAEHGWTHAYNTNDLEYLGKLGWVVDEPPVEPEAPVFAAPPTTPFPGVAPVVVAEKKKPGRKPKVK